MSQPRKTQTTPVTPPGPKTQTTPVTPPGPKTQTTPAMPPPPVMPPGPVMAPSPCVSLPYSFLAVEKVLKGQIAEAISRIYLEDIGKQFQMYIYQVVTRCLQPPYALPSSEEQEKVKESFCERMFVACYNEISRCEEAGMNALLKKAEEESKGTLKKNEKIDEMVRDFYDESDLLLEGKSDILLEAMSTTFNILMSYQQDFIQSDEQRRIQIYQYSLSHFMEVFREEAERIPEQSISAFRKKEEWLKSYIDSQQRKRREEPSLSYHRTVHMSRKPVGLERKLYAEHPDADSLPLSAVRVVGNLRPVPSEGPIFKDLECEIGHIIEAPDAGDKVYSSKTATPHKSWSRVIGEWGEKLVRNVLRQHLGEKVRNCLIVNAAEGKGLHFDIILTTKTMDLYIIEVKTTTHSMFRGAEGLSRLQKEWARKYQEYCVLVSVKWALTDHPEIRIWQNPLNSPEPDQ